MAQEINVAELSKALEKEKEERTRASIEAILARQRNGTWSTDVKKEERRRAMVRHKQGAVAELQEGSSDSSTPRIGVGNRPEGFISDDSPRIDEGHREGK